MFKTNAPDSSAGAYVDKNIGTNTPGTKLIADDRNCIQDELVNAVEKSAQVIDTSPGADFEQLARAMSIHGAVAMLCVDTGAADAYEISLHNTTIEAPNSYAQLDGAIFMFPVANENTGIAATIDFNGLGAKDFTLQGGGIPEAGDIKTSVIVTFSVANDRFELFVASASGGATGGGGNQAIYLNDQNITDNYEIPADQNGMSAGPIEIDDGVVLTVPDGATYTVV